MTERATSDRRANTPRQELLGSSLSALMALQFAVVVMFGKEIAAGDLPFPMLGIRFAGQSALLFVVLLILRKPLMAAPGERLPLILAATIGYGTEAALFFSNPAWPGPGKRWYAKPSGQWLPVAFGPLSGPLHLRRSKLMKPPFDPEPQTTPFLSMSPPRTPM